MSDQVSCAVEVQSALFTEQLIESVYNHPALYDTNHDEFKNIRNKDRIWKEIGREMDETVSGESLKKKWKNLRDTYMKYLRATKCSTGKAKKNYRDWQWAATMERFEPYVNVTETEPKVSRSIRKPSAIRSRVPRVCLGDDVNTEEEEKANIAANEYVIPVDVGMTDTPLKDTAKRLKTINTSNTEQFVEHFQIKTIEKMDDIDYLMQGYAKTIKKFSKRGQAVVKMKIAQIINQQEMEELETQSSSASTMPYNSMVEYSNVSYDN